MMGVSNSISIDIPDSFVYNKIKYAHTRGNGEGKLYVGQITEKEVFDNLFETNAICFDKNNLLEYLNKVFLVYTYHIFGEYREANQQYWTEMYSKVNSLDEKIIINEKVETFESGNRYYIRLQNEVFQKIFRRIALPVITNLKITKVYDQSINQDILSFDVYLKNNLEEELKKKFEDLVIDCYKENEEPCDMDKEATIIKPHNRILFGAPGTGKSYKVEEERKIFGENYERVTFHPNYSYAQFIGTYKPKPKFRADGTEYVSYEFVPGPFLRIWIKAQSSIKSGNNDNYLLVIEEINRANVAAVFGDIFQLLDRRADGTSEYEIATSEDMREYLINECGFTEDEVVTLKIPSNMYIWATMNSADQGVSPMDSAFKRRWNFQYIGINEGCSKILGKTITLKPYGKIEWNMLREKINNRLTQNDLNINEDKLIGPFFLSSKELNSDSVDEIFKSKLLMYLFEDVLKHRKGKLFKSEFNTFSKIIDAYDNSENIFDFEVVSILVDESSDESAISLVAENSEEYSIGNK